MPGARIHKPVNSSCHDAPPGATRIDKDQTLLNQGNRDRGKLAYLFAETQVSRAWLNSPPSAGIFLCLINITLTRLM